MIKIIEVLMAIILFSLGFQVRDLLFRLDAARYNKIIKNEFFIERDKNIKVRVDKIKVGKYKITARIIK